MSKRSIFVQQRGSKFWIERWNVVVKQKKGYIEFRTREGVISLLEEVESVPPSGGRYLKDKPILRASFERPSKRRIFTIFLDPLLRSQLSQIKYFEFYREDEWTREIDRSAARNVKFNVHVI